MMMNCQQAEILISACADGEVDALRNYSMEKHLLGCVGCAAKHQSMLELRARIRAEIPYFVASPALRARVLATVGAVRASVPPQLRPTNNRWRWLTGGVLAGCTASMFAWMVGTTLLAWRANEDFAVRCRGTRLQTLAVAIIEGDYVGRAFVMNIRFIEANHLIFCNQMNRQVVFTTWK
jgi:anti-sigma factor RsiW